VLDSASDVNTLEPMQLHGLGTPGRSGLHVGISHTVPYYGPASIPTVPYYEPATTVPAASQINCVNLVFSRREQRLTTMFVSQERPRPSLVEINSTQDFNR